MTENLSTSAVLNRAADLIESRGWTTGNEGVVVSAAGPLCMEGGIAAATGLRATSFVRRTGRMIYRYAAIKHCPAYIAVRNYLGTVPWEWNDAYGRTVVEVIEVLRAVALIESARETEAAEQPVEVSA